MDRGIIAVHFLLMRIVTLKIIFFVFLLSSFFGVSYSQVYPVQLSTQLLPPYSTYLPDYGDPANEKLKCILVLQDFSVTHRDVKLEIKITGNGFTIQTSAQYIPSPVTLTPGVPVLITASDLAPYLATQNLVFTGINAADYELRKILPEGYYTVCIKAVDYYNSNYTVVSNESCNSAWFFLNDPPYLNFPACEEEIVPVVPQNIIFQWTAMNLNSPNSALGTEYDFELYEIRPNNGIPNNIVQNSAPVFSITTAQPFFQYSITEPALYLGMKYVWRVRARDLSGRDLFKNDGWSQICTFTYGNINSAFPEDAFTLILNATASTHRQGKVWWNHIANFTQYHVQVRKTGTQNWFDYYSADPELKINELEPSTTYEARVMGTGNNLESDWSNTASFTTPAQPEYGCNDQTQQINALASNPLMVAYSGMIFQIGQFEMRATQITPDPGAPGFFSGYGVIKMYMVNINVEYNHVFINDNLQITSGSVNALTDGMEAWENEWLVELEDAFYTNSNVDSIIFNTDTSGIYVYTENGDSLFFEFPGMDHPIIINEPSGVQYIVWPDGTIETGVWLIYSDDYLDADAETKILFSASDDQQYGFDPYEHPEWFEEYEAIKLSDDSQYFVSNKSLKINGSDFVLAEYKGEDLIFTTGGGEILTAVLENNKYKISLQNFSDDGVVYAIRGTQRLGKLNVKVYEELEKEVVLVRVGNSSLPDENALISDIKKTFSAGVVKINLTLVQTYSSVSWDINGDGKLEAGNHSALADYSSEMKKLSNDWLNENEIDKDAYVLFIIPGFDAENVDKGGYMPLGRHKGFVKSGSDSKVLTHELAHGIFGLEHTFPEVGEGSTNNLLDYSAGKDLSYRQWKWMRNRFSQFNLFDDEDGGSYELSFATMESQMDGVPGNLNNDCNQFLTLFNKLISFSPEQQSKITDYVVVNRKLKGLYCNVNGEKKYFSQVHSVQYTNNENGGKTITSMEYNYSYICFDCLFENCEPVTEFTEQTICEKISALKSNGNETYIYKKIPEDYIIKVDQAVKNCEEGDPFVIGFNNGTPVCSQITIADCNTNDGENTGRPVSPEDLVKIEEVGSNLFATETDFSWMTLHNIPIQTGSFSSIAAAQYILGFSKNWKNYVACYAGSPNSLDETFFHVYVDKDRFEELENQLLENGLKIRVKDLSDEIIFSMDEFEKSNNGSPVHYKVLHPRFNCYFEYEFTHDGRAKYELEGDHFKNIIRSIYWRKSCALQVISNAMCGTAMAGAEQFANLVGQFVDIAMIPESAYNPEHPAYEGVYYGSYFQLDNNLWNGEQRNMLDFAFYCGLNNGVAKELQGIVDAFPLIIQYVCDSEFRDQINTALSEINFETIAATIEDDFEGNIFQQAEATGEYTISIISLVLPITQSGWVSKSASIVSKMKSLPKAVKKFVNKAKSNAIYGIKVVKENIQKIIFVNALNLEIELARFSDDGLIIFNESKVVSEVGGMTEELFDFGEITYKTSDAGEEITGELKLVRGSDGDVWVVRKILSFTEQQIDHYVNLATKQNSLPKVMLGKHDGGEATGYIARAGNDYTYFDMGSDNWNEAKNIVGNNSDEMWRINKKFLDEQKLLGKDFYFSHDPNLATGYFLREVNYLTVDLRGVVEKIDNTTWKIKW